MLTSLSDECSKRILVRSVPKITMIVFVATCFISSLIVSAVEGGALPTDVLQLELKFEGNSNCPGFDGPIKLTDLVLEQIKRNVMAISGKLELGVPLTEDIELKVSLIKCPSKTERAMCEEFPPSTIKDLCEKLPLKNQMWTTFVEELKEFDPHCPVAEGKYVFLKHPMDMSKTANLPVMKGYWKMKCEGYNKDGEKVMCTHSEFSFVEKKKKIG